jgi:hypothetical protein
MHDEGLECCDFLPFQHPLCSAIERRRCARRRARVHPTDLTRAENEPCARHASAASSPPPDGVCAARSPSIHADEFSPALAACPCSAASDPHASVGRAKGVYLARLRIFLRFLLSRLMRFFFHLALIFCRKQADTQQKQGEESARAKEERSKGRVAALNRRQQRQPQRQRQRERRDWADGTRAAAAPHCPSSAAVGSLEWLLGVADARLLVGMRLHVAASVKR